MGYIKDGRYPNRDNIILIECNHSLQKVMVIFNEVFSLDLNRLSLNKVPIFSDSKTTDQDKFFRLGNYHPTSYSKGSEVTGIITIGKDGIEELMASYKGHSPTSAVDGFIGGIIKIRKVHSKSKH